MPAINEGMYKTVFIMVIFIIMWGTFNALFVGSQIPAGLSASDYISSSLDIITQPELLIINLIFGSIGLIVTFFVVRELLPV